MKKALIVSVLLAGALVIPLTASAAQIKTFVATFTVTPEEAPGLKETLQRLLSSRLAGDGITTVSSAAEAEVVIAASFTRIGKVFSLDAVAKLPSGQTLATVYEQGESQDELIPALGRVSTKLKAETLQRYAAPAAAAQAPSLAAPAPAPLPAAAPAVPTRPAADRGETPQSATVGSTVWLSQRIAGAQSSIAPAAIAAGAREFFVAEGHKLRVYRQDKGLTLLAETEIPQREKVLSVESTGRSADGSLRAYLTIIDDETPASRIYSFESGKLKLAAQKLPYLFRAVALDGGPSRIYAQEMGRSEAFYGDVYEVFETGGKLELKNPIKMPQHGNIFNFNRFRDAAGKSYLTAFNSDGKLLVYSEAGEELWRSPENFSGSETYFQRDSQGLVRNIDSRTTWYFMDQRITVTDKGEVVVPQNDGFFVIGNHRSFTKYSLTCLAWNGSSMEERWKTKTAPNYLADYFFLPESKELVLLEVVQKEGTFSSGGSAVRVIRAQ